MDIENSRKILGEGFTIIELVMVIVIVGILAALAIPRFESFYTIKLNGAVKKVVSDIRYVQQLAVSRHDDYKITFNDSGNNYQVQRVSDSAYATDPFTRGNMIVNFNIDPQYNGIDINTVTFGSGVLRFNWQGVPQDVSGADLTSEGSFRLSYKGNNYTVIVTPNTGRVRAE